jgi:two-component system sensor histidine kinase UhpB
MDDEIIKISAAEYNHLKSKEEFFHAIFEESPFILVINDTEDEKYVDGNHFFSELVGYQKEELIGKTAMELGLSTDPDYHQRMLKLFQQEGQISNFEWNWPDKDGRIRNYLVWTKVIGIKEKKYAFTTLQDVTENTKFKNELIASESKYRGLYQQMLKTLSELRESQAQLRELASHLQEVREEEKISIAREIHDELGHLLTAVKLDLEEINENQRENIIITDKLEPVISLIDSCIDTARKISYDLHPGILDHFGLIAALEWMVEQFTIRTKIKCRFVLPEVLPDFSKSESIVVFRIFQEIFTNITRHSRANDIEISLKSHEQKVLFTILDDGIGFDTSLTAKNPSLGILSMKERAISIGAVLTIESEPGKGTVIRLQINQDGSSNDKTT